MTDMQELAERLLGGPNDDALFIRRIRNEAAEAILTLERERDEAREANAAFADICDELGCERDNEAGLQAAHDLKARALAAEAQVQALREALEQAFREGVEYGEGVDFPDYDAAWKVSRARAALRSEP